MSCFTTGFGPVVIGFGDLEFRVGCCLILVCGVWFLVLLSLCELCFGVLCVCV